MPEALEHLTFEASALMSTHPPQWIDRNKEAVFEISCPAGCKHRGTIEYSRWAAMSLPERVDLVDAFDRTVVVPTVYDYEPMRKPKRAMAWHVNFADPILFVAYASRLLAQDELQAAEHPALGAVRRALDAGGHTALTVEDGRPTPVLVAGVERRCHIDTQPNEEAGRPFGLYGNAFARANVETVRSATRAIKRPTISNLICIAAIACGTGRYTREQIEHTLIAAYSGFRAARLESDRLRGAGKPVVLHTGFWGCGAFGGNRGLMVLLQIMAANMAGIDLLVVHAVTERGTWQAHEGLARLEDGLSGKDGRPTAEALDYIAGLGFKWGMSDGN